MPMYFPPWDTDSEPNEGNIKQWMDNLYGKFEQMEQARWNEANIDALFYAGEQKYINSYFNFNSTQTFQNFYFNFLQQPINMVTGYQRQHRKTANFVPVQGSRQEEADDLTKVITFANNFRNRLEKFSKACELSAVSGLCLLQPYLDFNHDPVNGTLDLKVWSFNEFMVDPYFREPDMSDANFIWTQRYISKAEAVNTFPEKAEIIRNMAGFGNRYGKFYFLPENYNLARNDLLILSQIWYKSRRKKKMLYNQNDGITYDYNESEDHLQEMVQQTGFFEIIEVEVPTWKMVTVLNEELMYLGDNPLSFDECPLVPVFWNYDPHLGQNYDLRSRSLTRAMRSSQFLLNRRVILNHDISESSINSGYKYIENSIANPENLRYSGQGKDIVIKDGYDLGAIDKIIPNAVPPGDMELANQLVDFIYKTSGVNQELLGMAGDAQTGIQEMLRQGAGLVTLQKYFDQWDIAFKLMSNIDKRLIQRWSPAKIARIIGKEPSPEFMAKTFSEYDVLVTEGLNTVVQEQTQFRQMLELNEALGGIIPGRFILKYATIQGKNEIMEAVDQQQKQASEMEQQRLMLEQAKLESEIAYTQSKSTGEIALAHEREGRKDANIGLFEERLSEITHNRSMALKAKVDSLEKLLMLVREFGMADSGIQAARLQGENLLQKDDERTEELEARLLSNSNNQTINMMQNNPLQNTMGSNQSKSLRSALL